MALLRKVPVHFVSTETVSKLVRGDSIAPESLAAFPPFKEFQDGYAASKWVSKVFLERVEKEIGLQVAIHRPSSITGDGAGEGDLVANVLRYANLLKAVPESRGWTGFVDLISVEEVVQGLTGLVMEKRAEGIEFVHHSGGEVIPGGEIGETLKSDGKGEWEVLDMQQWVDQAVEKGMNPLVGEFLKAADRGNGLQIGQRLL